MEELDEKASNFSERRKRILAAAVPAERILESGRQAKSIMPELEVGGGGGGERERVVGHSFPGEQTKKKKKKSLKPSAVGFCLSDMQT